MAVVNEDRRAPGLVVVVGRETADVPAIAHRDQREDGDLGVLGRVQRAEQRLERKVAQSCVGELVPERLRDEVLLRQIEGVQVDDLVVGESLALERDHLLGHGHDPEPQRYPERLSALANLFDEGLGLDLRLRVVVGVGGAHERAATADVELVDLVGLAQMEVDRARMDGRERALRLDEPEQLARLGVDNGEAVGGGRAKRDRRGGEAGPPGKKASVSLAQLAGGDEPAGVLFELRPEQLEIVVVERRLVCGRDEMAHVDALGAVIEDRGFDRTAEELLRVTTEELVERVIARDVEGEAVSLAATGPAPLLAQARDRAREGDRDRGVEVADVDAELERARRDDAEQVAAYESALDLAPLLWRVAGAVGSDHVRERDALARVDSRSLRR